jgi:hypothetical protein
VNRLLLALAAYAVLGVLAWTTLTDHRIRLATLAILGLFAVKTWIRRKDVMHRDGEEKDVET